MPGIVGLGLDLCQIDRIERAMANAHFMERAFTQGERARIGDKGAATAAGYFAAKEAVAKALGTGFDGFFLDAVEVTTDALGCPHCTLHKGALLRFNALGGQSIHLSITHDAGVAAAVAVITG